MEPQSSTVRKNQVALRVLSTDCPSRAHSNRMRSAKSFCRWHSWWTRAVKRFFCNKTQISSLCEDRLPLVRAGGTFRLPARLLSDSSPCPVAVSLPSVGGPATKEERDRHLWTHLPHALWCPVCVQARSADAMHCVQPRVDPARPNVIQITRWVVTLLTSHKS